MNWLGWLEYLKHSPHRRTFMYLASLLEGSIIGFLIGIKYGFYSIPIVLITGFLAILAASLSE